MMRLVLFLIVSTVASAQVYRSTGWCGNFTGAARISGVSHVSCATGSNPLPISIPPGQTLSNGIVGVSYSQFITVTGGSPPYTSTVTAGALPAGISLGAANSSGIQLTGTPTTIGTFTFTLQACDTTVSCASAAFSLVVGSTVLTITTPSCPQAMVSQGYSCQLAASGGTAPYTWAITSGSLPAGLSLSSGGLISGTPTTVGTSTFTVTVTDAAGRRVSITGTVQ